MIGRLLSFVFFVSLFVQILGCSLPYQLRNYDQYYFHDLMVDQEKILVLLSKENYSPEVSLSAAMMNEMSTRTSFSELSYSLLSFDIDIFNSDWEENLKLFNKKNIVKQKNIDGINPHTRERIVDWSKLFFNYDIIDLIPCTSVLNLENHFYSTHITCRRDIIAPQLSFDRKSVFYIINNQVFIYDIEKGENLELQSNVNKESFFEQFDSTKYFIGDNWFVDFSLTDNKLTPYKLSVINKKTGQVNGNILSKFRIVKDLSFSRKLALVFRSSIGFKIYNFEGNELYSLGNEWTKNISRAVLHEDKVYAAGITTRDTPFGKKDYIEIIQWDYKNDSVIKKYYPCDSPELEM